MFTRLGWVFSHFQALQVTLWQLDPLRGSSYIPLPQWIETRRAVVNVAGTDDDCFKWAILAGMCPVDVHADRRVWLLFFVFSRPIPVRWSVCAEK